MFETTLIGYCKMCDEPIYSDEEYFVTIYDEVIHEGECLDEYNYEYQNI